MPAETAGGLPRDPPGAARTGQGPRLGSTGRSTRRTSGATGTAGAEPSIRRILEEHGPLAVKVGQYLACRPDVVPPDRLDELLLLVDGSEPTPWDQVRTTISTELGQPVDQLFEWINPRPELSGALTQVHLARTIDGAHVSVKVARPGAIDAADRSPVVSKALRKLAAPLGLDAADRKQLAEEIRLWLLDAADLERERRDAARMHELSLREQRYRVPAPYAEYSTARILTSELLRGVRLTDLLPIAGVPGHRFQGLGLSRHAVADNVVEAVLQQVFALGRFDATPHPSSLVVLGNGQIGFVDLASTDRIDVSARDRQLAFTSAVRSGDLDRVVRSASAMLATEARDLDGFRNDYLGEVRRFSRDANIVGEGRTELAQHMRALVQVAHRHAMPIGPEVLAYHRAVLTADAVARILSPHSGLDSVADRFFLRLQVEAAVGELAFDKAQAVLLDGLDLVTEGPGQLGRVLSDLADDRFQLRVVTSESDEDRRAGHARARLVSMAVIFVGVSVLVASPGITDAGLGVRALAYASLAVLVVVIVALWVRLS